MPRMSNHSKERSLERVEGIDTIPEAKQAEKQAFLYGKTLNSFLRYPKFFAYLQTKRGQTNTTSIRVFKDHIYIWRGKNRTLITVMPIPDRFKEEMRRIDNVSIF